jgi:nitrogen fixation NifU-like protein
MDIYQEIILDHYQHPRNYGKLKDGKILKLDNPSCGDTLTFSLQIENSMIKDIQFEGSGCVISQASASILSEEIKGKSIEEVQKMTKDDILKLLGIELGSARLKCALLSLETVKKILLQYNKS